MKLQLFLSVFGVIFLAELPDKTALAALVLATRYRPLPVFLGAALALTVQSLVAVAAGGLLSLLPARPVHVGAGILFLVFAVLMWRRRQEDEEEQRAVHGGDRAHVPAGDGERVRRGVPRGVGGSHAARHRHPGGALCAAAIVFCAATLALWCVTAIAVVAGNRAGKLLDPERTKKIAAVIFAALGVLLIAGVM